MCSVELLKHPGILQVPLRETVPTPGIGWSPLKQAIEPMFTGRRWTRPVTGLHLLVRGRVFLKGCHLRKFRKLPLRLLHSPQDYLLPRSEVFCDPALPNSISGITEILGKLKGGPMPNPILAPSFFVHGEAMCSPSSISSTSNEIIVGVPSKRVKEGSTACFASSNLSEASFLALLQGVVWQTVPAR